MLLLSALSALLLAPLIRANTEKTIFSAPPPDALVLLSGLDKADPPLSILTPANATLRTHLASAFSSADEPYGAATWIVVRDLVPGQRYEVRVCWAATEPAAFTVDTFDIPTLAASPALLPAPLSISVSPSSSPPSSTLLLRILTAADYVTTNTDLRAAPPPVFADVILDAYWYNVVPQSLLPTIGVIALIAPAALVLGRVLAKWIGSFAVTVYQDEEETEKKKEA
ncbi:hypothetical protein TD95_001987 [Thielaviopsis punctulata]|uniref:Uncharacterized protein n=1 Tax=Thielaviopsis punctulata TaxID=72032 RepID=A0A0F4ZAD6_9PEZI|nr:hypothetical protein TD95_001987 [Thielaviopsis punctulata]